MENETKEIAKLLCTEHRFHVFSVLLGTGFRCKECQKAFVYSDSWLLSFLKLIKTLSFVFPCFYGVFGSFKAYWFFGIWFLFFAMCSCIAYKFVPLEIDETEGETSCVKHYFYVKDKFLSVMFGINFECRQCHKVFTRSAGWLSFLALIEIISFFFAVGYSIQSGIYWPFGVWGGFVVLCFYISYLLVPIQLKRDIHLKKFGFALTKRDLISLGLLCLLILVNSRMDRLIEIFKKILL